MTSFVHINHKVEKTKPATLVHQLRSLYTVRVGDYIELNTTTTTTIRCKNHWQSNALLDNGYMARYHSKTSPLSA